MELLTTDRDGDDGVSQRRLPISTACCRRAPRCEFRSSSPRSLRGNSSPVAKHGDLLYCMLKMMTVQQYMPVFVVSGEQHIGGVSDWCRGVPTPPDSSSDGGCGGPDRGSDRPYLPSAVVPAVHSGRCSGTPEQRGLPTVADRRCFSLQLPMLFIHVT